MAAAEFGVVVPRLDDAEELASVHVQAWREACGQLFPQHCYDDAARESRRAMWSGLLSEDDPDEHLHRLTAFASYSLRGRRGGHCYYELGRPLWSHAYATVPDGNANRRRATPIKLVGSRERELPVEHLDRVWPDSGPTTSVK